MPKVGFKNPFRKELRGHQRRSVGPFAAGATVDLDSLRSQIGLLRQELDGVKILGGGELDRALTIKAHRFSASAKAKIEKAGGKAEVILELAALANIFKIPELRRRLLFTVGMLAVYRVGVFITTPGVNREAMQELIKSGGLFGMFNLFSGGALEQFSIFALGIMPNTSRPRSSSPAAVTVVIPSLEKLQKQG